MYSSGGEEIVKSEKMVPDIYVQSWDLRTICRIFDIEMDLLRYYTEHILDCYSPEHCPENLLPELAEHIGFDYQELKTVMYNRVVLKHFIRDMIRYRGSITGIANAAAIDIRYRQVYSAEKLNPVTGKWEPDDLAGKTIPMTYHEGIPIEKTWIDVDHPNGIIYLFIISEGYFPPIPNDATEEEKQELYNERMRRLLDLSYLQEYVRPVGMYLLPMVARKVNAKTDLTIKAIRIPTEERTKKNGVLGTPNASLEHKYDRMHFAKVENPSDEVNIEPWLRTLYHSQLAGNLNHSYFTKPVYHIEGKFLYYDHDELMTIYQQIMQSPEGTLGMKVGDTLYNPNLFRGPQSFNYGPDPANEPKSLQEEGRAVDHTEPLRYDDHGVFKNVPVRQAQDIDIPELIPNPLPGAIPDSQNDFPTYMYAGVLNQPGDADDGTNKNLLINLFEIDDIPEGHSKYTGTDDVQIAGKGVVDRSPVPYDPTKNDEPVGDDAYYTVHNSEGPEDEPLIP